MVNHEFLRLEKGEMASVCAADRCFGNSGSGWSHGGGGGIDHDSAPSCLLMQITRNSEET